MEHKVLWRRLELTAIVLLLALIALLSAGQKRSDPAEQDDKACTLSAGWYVLADGKRVDVALPESLSSAADGTLTLCNDTLTQADAGKMLSARGVQYGLEIWQGEQLLYRYQDNAFPKNSQMKGKLWADVLLTDKTGAQTLRLVYTGIQAGDSVLIAAPELGTTQQINGRHLQQSALSILIMLSMFGVSVLAIAAYAFLQQHKLHERRFLDAALFLFMCGIWSMTDSGLFQLYGHDTAFWSMISFYAFMLMSVPMLHFIKNTVSGTARRLPRLFTVLLYLNAAVQGLCSLLFGVPLTSMLAVTHLLQGGGIVAMTLLLYREYRRTRTRDVKLCMLAFGLLGFCCAAALVLYWLFDIYWYDSLFQLGILLYMGLLFWGLVCKATADARAAMERRIAERMALTDRMTGLKNRRAFEDYMDAVRTDAAQYSGAVLTYIHLEGLKNLNDTYGMHAGDEAVIGTARCIEAACAADPESLTEYFRVRGDEFALVRLAPQRERADRVRLLEMQVKKYNDSVPHGQLRLSYGSAALLGKNGVLRTVSDWKACADADLRKNQREGGCK